MQQAANIERAAEARAVPRTNMFLAAVLQGTGFSAPVKIRNMSSEGALVEAASVPPAGAAVRLLRGSLVVPASVAWSAERRCGLRFSSIVSVRDWLAPPANAEQQRVDDLVRVVKAGAVPFAAHRSAGPAARPGAGALLARLEEDLLRATQLIEAVSEDLVCDEAALARHGQRLMDLDIAVQTISAVAGILTGGGDETAALSRLENLRTSSAQALRR